jgi:uncharacterized protein
MAGLIEAVKAKDLAGVESALDGGAGLDERDDHGWTALNWAAGAGEVPLVELLLERGADPLATGRDQRTPYQIAVAAGHADAAIVLRDAEDRADPEAAARREQRAYCRAYELGALRRFPDWDEAPGGDAAGDEELGDDSVVFLHEDLTVTRSMWRGEDVLFDRTSDEWAEFCRGELEFRVPDDLDLIPTTH